MFDFEEKYYKYTKQGLRMYGLWFDQNIYKNLAGLLAWYILMASVIVPMVIMFMEEYENMTIMMDDMIMILFYIGITVKFTIGFMSFTKMKALYEKIGKDWKKITKCSEREILQGYCDPVIPMTKFYRLYWILVSIVCSSRPFLPLLANKIAPLENGTRPAAMPYYSNYVLFDQADYLFWVTAYLFGIHILALVPFVSGIDSLYMNTVSHMCGLFAIVRHRIDTAMEIQEKDDSVIYKDSEIRKNLKEAIELHNESISSIQLLEDSFSQCFLAVIAMSVVGIGLVGTYILIVAEDGYQFFRYTAICFGLVLHLLLINWIGQQLIDNTEDVFNSAYSREWYLVSPTTRKYIILIMVRSNYPCTITAGKLLNVSMETFGMIMRNAASYFAVFSSLT